MTKTFNISLSDWIVREIIGENNKNRSKKIEEYIVKGYMAEREERMRKQFISSKPVEKVNGNGGT